MDTLVLSLDALDRAVVNLKGALAGADPAVRTAFLTQYVDDSIEDDLADLSLADIAQLVDGLWAFGSSQTDDNGHVRLLSPKGAAGFMGRDVIEIAQPDRPFLVDSVMGEIAAHGARVRAMFHPSVELNGRRRSFIQVHLDPIVGEDRRAALLAGLEETLSDAQLAVSDWAAMKARMEETITALEAAKLSVSDAEKAECVAFLKWIRQDHFVFLGVRDYVYTMTATGDYAQDEPDFAPVAGLGLLRDQSRHVLRRAHEPAALTKQVKQFLQEEAPLVVAKSNLRTRVHRRAYMDYVGVKTFDKDGKPVGEVRFVGLFTAEAYDRSVRETPLIRLKISNVMARAAKIPGSHSAKKLQNILENYPRDELFQMSEDELLSFALGILHMLDRPRPRLFLRLDKFDRFASALVFIPRDRFNAAVRANVGEILRRAFEGRLSAYYPGSGEGALAHVHYIIGLNPGEHPNPDLKTLEVEVAKACESWDDHFEAALRRDMVSLTPSDILNRYKDAFSAAYREAFDADESLRDIMVIERMSGSDAVDVRAYAHPRDPSTRMHFKLYRAGQPAPLADVLPVLENMGLRAMVESGYAVRRQSPLGGDGSVWVHDFELSSVDADALDIAVLKDPFEAAFRAIWSGAAENDGFNALILKLGITWREAALMRALCRYRQQSGLDPSQTVQEQVLSEYPQITRLILSLFSTRLDPASDMDLEIRKIRSNEIGREIDTALDAVTNLDADRVLRRLAKLVAAIARTNFYQADADGTPKTYISFKVMSRELEDLPLPKPYREIFVSAPHIEGVHLRFGPVARGGLRWSDRRDDFRTEVLGLVKAQQVKNAVIVPVGSKGGFYPKSLPKGGTREEIQAEGIRAYKTFLSGLLDITDNLDVSGGIKRPHSVVALDADDPYLVVAADKGTATFSDIANSVANDYGFWLGDAFASGGSVGYDHKVMGITARGAWEAVKRHFREMGKDIQSEDFTVAGVGDMSGDVFGNGMLLSKHIRLVAAFDHRHIFIDPNPDAATSWVERQRMFNLPRSSWADYDASLISKGGGIFARDLKKISLTPEIKALLDLSVDEITPSDLMRAILKARVELMYFGGIGTYIKAPAESNSDVGDKANDAQRIDGTELRAKVVGEGANLALTQAGRISFARAGGRINTDAIDNSAGVDSSDHEVNIKILVDGAIRGGALKAADRNALLASMTDEVGDLVLVDNYDQTLTLTLQQATAARDLEAHERFIQKLEGEGKLDRKVEGLPSSDAFRTLAEQKQGLTRPELAVVQAYAKIVLFDEIVASTAPDDGFFATHLRDYFPKPLATFEAARNGHRLKREIIGTIMANRIVNLCGATFPARLMDAAGVDAGGLVTAFYAASAIFRFDELVDAIHALDGQVPAAAQTALYMDVTTMLRRQTYWLARRALTPGVTVKALVDRYQPSIDTLRAEGLEIVSAFDRKWVEKRTKDLVELGAPKDLAFAVAALKPHVSATDVVDLAHSQNVALVPAARVYHTLGSTLEFDRLRNAAGRVPAADHFERQATRRVIEDLLAQQRALAEVVLTQSPPKPGAEASWAKDAVHAWSKTKGTSVKGAKATLDALEGSTGGWSFAKLTIAAAALRGV